MFWHFPSFHTIVLPIVYQRRTSILSNISQFHSRCSRAAMKCSTSKHKIVCFSINWLLWTIGDNWIPCIMCCDGQISPQSSPSIAWLSILTIHFIIGRRWLVCIWTKCQPRSRIHLSTQVVAGIYSWKSVSYREGTWVIFFINDITSEWNWCFPFFMKLFLRNKSTSVWMESMSMSPLLTTSTSSRAKDPYCWLSGEFIVYSMSVHYL